VFINTVVDDLVHHMVQAIDPGAANIHGGSFLNRFQSLQDTDLIGIIPGIRVLAVYRAGRFWARCFRGFHTFSGFVRVEE
jgi:hypothetical protein